eukprot:TRINITY_DN3654_c0_g2_i3.p2 TRINITY_DN3654_c0_g2~~TRINITY_DN3654_c0_g2_i3.p2  ORF type:complete len:231 (-),score=24.82 TRINITY_DN3654_c0_g2_i3:342-1034(-)
MCIRDSTVTLLDSIQESYNQLQPYQYNNPKDDDKDAVELSDWYQFQDGTLYKGHWNKGKCSGKGQLISNNDFYYEGYFSNNKLHGHGRRITYEGLIYDGEFANNKANGYGIQTDSKGAKYKGSWKDDQKEGYGEEQWEDGAFFTGNYKQGLKNGNGKFVWVDQSNYEGEFQENIIHGHGRYSWQYNNSIQPYTPPFILQKQLYIIMYLYSPALFDKNNFIITQKERWKSI